MLPTATPIARPRALAVVVAVAVACATMLIAAPVAHAAAVSDADALRSEVSSAGGDPTVVLDADIDTAGLLEFQRDLTLDLAGHHLTAAGVQLNPGTTVTIADSAGGGALTTTPPADSYRAGIRTTEATLRITGGTITARGAAGVGGGSGGAGIGGSSGGGAGNITITGGMVRATGGVQSAGIGSGFGGPGGNVTVSGGTVEARGGMHGAGIGTGAASGASTSGTVKVTGGSVTAHGGTGGAGIGGGIGSRGATVDLLGGEITARSDSGLGIGGGYGGGSNEDGGDVVIGEGAQVTAASSSPDISAIGARPFVQFNGEPPFGSLTVAGELFLPADTALIVQDGITVPVTATGRITGEGALTGPGTIANAGTITNSDVSAEVTGHNYVVTFEPNLPHGELAPQTVRVFATTFAAGERQLAPAPADGTLAGWFSAADEGEAFTTTTPLAGDRTVYAQWTPDRLALSVASPNATAGDTVSFDVELFSDQLPVRDVTDEVRLSVPEGAELTADGLILTRAGENVVTATLPGEPELTATATVIVAADEVASLAMTLADRVDEGDTLTAAVEGADRFGNPREDVEQLVTLTSDHPSDIVDGLTITFPTASEHVITATLDSDPTVTASAVVTVVPAAVPNPPAEEPEPSPQAPEADNTPVSDEQAHGPLPDAGGVDAALVVLAAALVAGAVIAFGAARARRT